MKMFGKTKVHPLGDEDFEENKSLIGKIWNAVFAPTIKETLEQADEKFENFVTKRENEINSIVRDGKCSLPWWYFLWVFVGIGLGIVAVCIGFVFWPTDNVFLEPEKWYQCVLQCGLVWIGKIRHEKSFKPSAATFLLVSTKAQLGFSMPLFLLSCLLSSPTIRVGL